MKPTLKKNITAATLCLLGFCLGSQAATLIVSDNIETNGDVTAETGTITTAWAGFGITTGDGEFYTGAVVNGVAGGFAGNFPANHPNIGTVTYAGTIAAGTYTFSLKVVNPNNAGFQPINSLTFGGALATADAGNTDPVSGGSSVFSYQLVIPEGSGFIGNSLSVSIDSFTPSGFANNGLDQLDISFEAIPEPSSAALLGLAGFALILRRRK